MYVILFGTISVGRLEAESQKLEIVRTTVMIRELGVADLWSNSSFESLLFSVKLC